MVILSGASLSTGVIFRVNQNAYSANCQVSMMTGNVTQCQALRHAMGKLKI